MIPGFQKYGPALPVFLLLIGSGCGLIGGKAEPEPISSTHYRPYRASYRGISSSEIQQQFDIQTTETAFAFEFFLRVSVDDSFGSMETDLAVDSVFLRDGASGGFGSSQVDSARGVEYQATLHPDGRLIDFAGGEQGGSFAAEIADRVLKQFFPLIPDSGVKSGVRWADTLSNDVNIDGVTNVVRTISDHAAMGWTDYAGVRAMRIQTTSVYELSGEGNQMGRDFTITGTGRRSSDRYVGEDGRYLGSVSVDTTRLQALLTASGDIVPIHQVRVDSIIIEQ
ncbi:MAG: hypothetical protein QNJ97_28495 [Myxococcota bacterium]|nr:hypothetical protein [Myxococcota bacterium]